MLDALLATFGALAVLASIAAKFVKSSADTVADDDAGRDQLHDNVMTFSRLAERPSLPPSLQASTSPVASVNSNG